MMQALAQEPMRPGGPDERPEGVRLPFFTLELDEDTPVISFSAEKGLGKEELLQVIFDHVTGGEAEAR